MLELAPRRRARLFPAWGLPQSPVGGLAATLKEATHGVGTIGTVPGDDPAAGDDEPRVRAERRARLRLAQPTGHGADGYLHGGRPLHRRAGLTRLPARCRGG